MWYVADVPIVERNQGLVFSLFFFTTLSFLAVVMRIVTRAALVRNFGTDDYFIVLASVGSIGFLVAVLLREYEHLGCSLD